MTDSNLAARVTALEKALLDQKNDNDQLRNRNAALEESIRNLKEQFLATEREEEYVTNKLIKRMDELKKEKEELALKIEQEEEYLTNTLQRKLHQLRQEKVDLENQLEQEEEFIVNKLQKQLEDMRKEKESLEHKVEEMEGTDINVLVQVEEKCKKSQQLNEDLKEKLMQLRVQNFDLQQQISSEQEKYHSVQVSQSKLALDAEVEMERAYNSRRGSFGDGASLGVPKLKKPILRASSKPNLIGHPSVTPPQPIIKTSVPRHRNPNRASVSPLRSASSVSPMRSSLAISIPSMGTPPSSFTEMISPRHMKSYRRRRSTSANPSDKLPKRPLSARFTPVNLSTPPIRQPLAHLSEEKYVKKGWLKRKDAYYPKWKKQFFFLFPNGELYCYDTHATRLFLKLDTITRLQMARNPNKHGTYSLRLTTVHNHEYKLGTDNKEDMESWAFLIKGLAPRLRRGSLSLDSSHTTSPRRSLTVARSVSKPEATLPTAAASK